MQRGFGEGAEDADRRPEPSGNFTACREAAGRLLGIGKPCSHERCGARGSYLAPSRADMKWLATENFFYTAQFLGVGGRGNPASGGKGVDRGGGKPWQGGDATLQEVARTGEAVCSADWVRLAAERRLPEVGRRRR